MNVSGPTEGQCVRLEHVTHRTFSLIGDLTFTFLVSHLTGLYSSDGTVFGNLTLPLEYPKEVEPG
jgi:hypothetical protein